MFARKKSGFTLIELLVVIAIIAILAAILFPVFARAREAARKATCQSNLKECAIALQTYWNDYDAMLPSSLVGAMADNASATTTDSTHQNLFCFGLGASENILPPVAGTRMVTWAQILYDHMKSKDIMFCPSDSVNAGTFAGTTSSATQASGSGTSTLSYWWKYSADLAWNTDSIKARKEGDFVYNSDSVIFYEHAGFHFGDLTGIRATTQINCAFMDSHVKTVSITSAPTSSYIDTPSAAISTPASPAFPNYDADGTMGGTIASGSPKRITPATTYINPRFFCDNF